MRLSLALTVVLAVSLSAASPGPPSAADPGAIGPYAVGHTSFVLEDASRSVTLNAPGGPITAARPIPVHVFYPVDQGSVIASTPEAVYPLDMIYHATDRQFLTTSTEWEAQGIDRAYQQPVPSADRPFPLVMFSPGYGNAAWSAWFVGTRLASHGFVVAILYHYGDAAFGYEPPREHVAVASVNRPLDVSFALTHVLASSTTPGNLLSNVADPDKVAASGWSLGGYAAMALAAGDDSVCDKFPQGPRTTCVTTLPDPRVKAIATLDGSTQLLWFEEMARIRVPTLGIGREWSTLAETPGMESWQARLHSATQGHPAYRVDVAGTAHPTFSNRCEALPILLAHGLISQTAYKNGLQTFCGAPLSTGEAHRIVTQYMVAFLKTTLAHEAGYQDILTPGYALTRESMVEFFVTEKRSPQSIDEDWPDAFWYFPHQPGSVQARAEKNPTMVVEVPHFGEIGRE